MKALSFTQGTSEGSKEDLYLSRFLEKATEMSIRYFKNKIEFLQDSMVFTDVREPGYIYNNIHSHSRVLSMRSSCGCPPSFTEPFDAGCWTQMRNVLHINILNCFYIGPFQNIVIPWKYCVLVSFLKKNICY